MKWNSDATVCIRRPQCVSCRLKLIVHPLSKAESNSIMTFVVIWKNIECNDGKKKSGKYQISLPFSQLKKFT